MKRICPFCDYDLQGTPTLTCPECGKGAKAILRVRKKFHRSSYYWMFVTFAATLTSTFFRFQYQSQYRHIDTSTIWITTISLVCGVSFLGVLLNVYKPKVLHKTEFLLWIRCSFWLYLPPILISILAYAAFTWNDYRTKDLQPGNAQIGHEWWLTVHQITDPYLLFPFIAFVIWIFQWLHLRKKAALPKRNVFLPIFFAIISIAAGWLAGFIDIAVQFID